MGLESTGIQLDPGTETEQATEMREGTATDSGNGRGPQQATLGGATSAGVLLLDTSPDRYGASEGQYSVPGLFAQATKRAFDLIGSMLLLVLLAPLWIAIAILIKADSPGPILFRQRRIGHGGKPFGMVKFRTMVNGADAHKPALLHLNDAAEGLFKINDDPRVTRVGRWLRATCLDEMPQLVHVVTGKMSLVGPRPLVPEEDVQIQGVYRERHTVRPGMTGPWQVEGASAIPIHGMVLLDRYYIEEWSLWLDVKLLGRTAGLVVARRGL